MEENKHFRCSFCGKTDTEVNKLLSGPGVYICDECVATCNQILGGEFESKSELASSELPKPKEIKEFLDEYVVKQMWVHCSSSAGGVALNSPTYVTQFRRRKDIDLEADFTPAPIEQGVNDG